MINKIEINKEGFFINKHLKDLELPKELIFKEGVNIVYGKNGSGKTSLFNEYAESLGSLEFGFPNFTQVGLGETSNKIPSAGFYTCKYEVLKNHALKIDSDKSPVVFCNPERTQHLNKLQKYDMEVQLLPTIIQLEHSKKSQGQVGSDWFEIALTMVTDFKKGDKQYSFEKRSSYNELKDWIKSNVGEMPKEIKPTLIIDEVERSMDVQSQIDFMNICMNFSEIENVQMIIITHNPLWLTVKDVNLVELESGYIEECKEKLSFWNMNSCI